MAATNASSTRTEDERPHADGGPPWPPVSARRGEPSWPHLAADALPPLATTAFPTVRDRFERLVTTAIVPAAPDRIWRALVEPDEVGMWLGRCHGSLAEPGRDAVLDFEDGEFFLVRPQSAARPDDGGHGELRWVWRWLGIG